MKTIWIVANWKSNKTIKDALEWLEVVGPALENRDQVKVAVCPSFIALSEVKKAVLAAGYPILVGAQNLSPFGPGAFTGEVSTEMVQGIADLSILGHSERRKNFGETDQTIEDKVILTKRAGIRPLLCVQDQNTPIPSVIDLVAYEPIFAIGSGTPDTPDNADKVARQIREKRNFQLDVLYGGSVKAENAASFLEKDNIAGLLIGGASLDAQEFVKIVQAAYSLS
jgi:triosephosphate isomerase (TIM)